MREKKKRVRDYPFFSDKNMDVCGLVEFCKSVLKGYITDGKKKICLRLPSLLQTSVELMLFCVTHRVTEFLDITNFWSWKSPVLIFQSECLTYNNNNWFMVELMDTNAICPASKKKKMVGGRIFSFLKIRI